MLRVSCAFASRVVIKSILFYCSILNDSILFLSVRVFLVYSPQRTFIASSSATACHHHTYRFSLFPVVVPWETSDFTDVFINLCLDRELVSSFSIPAELLYVRSPFVAFRIHTYNGLLRVVLFFRWCTVFSASSLVADRRISTSTRQRRT